MLNTINKQSDFQFKIPQNLKEKVSTRTSKNPTLKSNGQPKARASEPLRNKEDVRAIMNYFLNSSQANKYRNYMIFVLGINTRRRCGDLTNLKVGDVYDPNTDKIYEEVYIREEKTGKSEIIYMNKYCKEAIRLYLSHKYKDKEYNLDDWLFWSQKPDANGDHKITVVQIWRILNNACKALGIDAHVGTHTMRKTGARELYLSNPDDKEALAMLQEDLHHSSQNTTLRYIGISEDKRKELIMNINWEN